MANAVNELQVGDVFRTTMDSANRGRGVWFSPTVRWKKISPQLVEAVQLGKSRVGDITPVPVQKYVSEFENVNILFLQGAEASRQAVAAATLQPFHVERAQRGDAIVCWTPDPMNKNHGTFSPVYYIGRTRRGLIAVEHPAPYHIAAVDEGMLRMAPAPISHPTKDVA